MTHIHSKKETWKDFEKAELPVIKKINMKKIIQKGDELTVSVDTENSDHILYFLTNSKGIMISSNMLKLKEDSHFIRHNFR